MLKDGFMNWRLDRKLIKSADYAMQAADNFVLVDAGSAAATISITLPPAGEAAGRGVFGVRVVTASANVVVQDNDDAAGWSDVTLSATHDFWTGVSDGGFWYTVQAYYGASYL